MINFTTSLNQTKLLILGSKDYFSQNFTTVTTHTLGPHPYTHLDHRVRLWQGWGHVAGWDMWQGGTCGRVGHVAGCGGMWWKSGGWKWGHVAGVEICGRGQANGMDGDMWQGEGVCDRVWSHVTGGGGIW